MKKIVPIKDLQMTPEMLKTTTLGNWACCDSGKQFVPHAQEEEYFFWLQKYFQLC